MFKKDLENSLALIIYQFFVVTFKFSFPHNVQARPGEYPSVDYLSIVYLRLTFCFGPFLSSLISFALFYLCICNFENVEITNISKQHINLKNNKSSAH